MTTKLVLFPHETMKQARAKKRLRDDAGLVHEAIRNNEGISGKQAIADITGLAVQRVAECIDRIKRGDLGLVRVEYGTSKPRGGPRAGTACTGWFAMNLKRHHHLMVQADEHAALVEVGVRRSRLERLIEAQGIPGADTFVAQIETTLGVSIEAMSETDLAAFTELLLAEDVIEP